MYKKNRLLRLALAATLLLGNRPSSAQEAANIDPSSSPLHYVYQRDWTYGYARLPGQEEMRNATAGTPLVSVTYLGQHGDRYDINIEHDYLPPQILHLYCKLPCSVATVEQIVSPVTLKVQTVPVPSTSILGAIVKDAVAGKLVAFGYTAQGKWDSAQNQADRILASMDAARPWTSTPYAITIRNPLAPSFDCEGTRSAAEKLICRQPELAKADHHFTERYFIAQLVAKDQAAFERIVRRRWEERDRICDDAACVSAWFRRQQEYLDAVVHSGDVAEN